MNSSFSLPHGEFRFPAFLPDATFGVVRAVDAIDLRSCRVDAVVMNSYHLMQRPGSSTIQALGGLHRMSGWSGPIVTDSGGFQAYSLIHQNPKFGSITDQGLIFRPEGSERKFQLTPEKGVQLQINYGADVVMCLDDCTHVDAPDTDQRSSVRRTIAWAKRARKEYDRLIEQKHLSETQRPRLFAVIQGGGSLALRQECAESLLEIGFDGYGYGGWPLDKDGNLLTEILGYTREMIPSQFPMHALGVGHPKNVITCWRLGYGIFDSAMPTRDARHGRLYVFTKAELQGEWFGYLYINDEPHIKDDRPIEPGCDCLTCQNFSRGYLRHLFKINDNLFFRLATLHNLRFMTRLTEHLQRGSE